MGHGGGWLGWLNWLDFGSTRAHFAIQVPRNYPIDPQDASGSVEAGTSGGGVTSDFPLSTTHAFGGGHLQGTLGGGGAPIYLHTSGGGIHLEWED